MKNPSAAALLASTMGMGSKGIETYPISRAPRDVSWIVPTKYRHGKPKGRKSPFRGLAVPRTPGMRSEESHCC